MTKWEIGQDIIKINDAMCEVVTELRENGHGVISNRLNTIRALVGDLFNDCNDHTFGIFDSDSINKYPETTNSTQETK